MQPPRDPASGRIRVLYVAGTGRSGSTLVSNLLGSAPGMVSLGELRYLWERGLRDNSVCGCGRPVADCPFWRSVLARAHPNGAPDVGGVMAADARLLRVRSLRHLAHMTGPKPDVDETARAYTDEIARMYGAICDETGGAVIVDSSNLPGYGRLLGCLDGIDLYVLHLVRDPRGVAHSWNRARDRSDRGTGGQAMGREGLVKSVLLWNLWNATSLRWWGGSPRYVRVRYEDVVRDPRAALEPVARMLGIAPATVPAVRDGYVELAVSHTVAGNPVRTIAGRLRLTADDEWTTAMPLARRIAAAALSAPLRRRFGYRMRPAPPTGGPSGAGRVFVEDLHGFARFRARVRRNLQWIRTEGLARVLEEKEVAPVRNTVAAFGKARYRKHASAGSRGAVPVFVVGLQRSGTNMLMRGLAAAPETEIHNEDDPAAFERYKLRPLPAVEALVQKSPHSHVIFKPLCDSHRTDELLDGLSTRREPLAVWTYRDVDGRVRSALAKFGDGNLQVLREFAEGVNTSRWHVQRMSTDTAELVRSFDYERLSPASGAALMWYVRNQLYFDLRLDQRPDTYLVSYNDFLAEPEHTMQSLCAFLGFPYRPALIRHVSARPPSYRAPLDIDPRIRARCDALADRLATVGRARASTGT